MKYRIIGTTIPAVEIKFDAPGETMYTQSGGMSWMSEGISMSTNTRGGFMKGLGRMFAGESMFMATYRADAPGATIASSLNPSPVPEWPFSKSTAMLSRNSSHRAK